MPSEENAWIPLAAPSNRHRAKTALLLYGLPVYGAGYLAFFVTQAIGPAALWPPLFVMLAVIGLIGGIVAFRVFHSNPPVTVNLESRLVCLRRRPVPFEEITRAHLGPYGSVKKPVLVLTLGTAGRRVGMVMLRDHNDTPMSEAARGALLSVLNGSSVTRPISPDDPTEKFAKYNFPGQLTKSEALSLVERNPKIDEPLPGISPWR